MSRHFLSLADITRDELTLLLEIGLSLKKGGRPAGEKPLGGKTLLLIFNKPSTRTRVSFQVGMYQLGGLAIDLRIGEIQINRGETIKDTAEVISRYSDAVVIRTFDQDEVVEWGRHSSIPVINGLTDAFHPCQILSDLLTIKEAKGTIDGLKLAYIGDGNNVLHSWIMAATLVDIELAMAVPEGFDPAGKILAEAAEIGFRGAPPRLMRHPLEAAEGADIIYTDVWASMGQEQEKEDRRKAFEGYQVNQSLIDAAAPDVIVMHCLPAHRGEEISAEAIDGPKSIVIDQAENRLHMQKALLLHLMGDKRNLKL